MVNQKEKDLEGAIYHILDYAKALNNKHRRKILELCREKPRTITELVRLLKSSNKVTFYNIKHLERASLVKLDKRNNEKHHPVYVSSNLTPEEAFISMKALIDVFVFGGK